jgi:flagellar biosynthesis/type III secretory pathway ATPase
MPRPKKKKIDVNQESVLSLLQEIYNECVEQRNTAIRIQNKMLSFMKEATDLTLLGPVIKEQQKIIDSAIEKKLQLSKLQSALLQKNIKSDSGISLLDSDVRDSINQLLDGGVGEDKL